MKTKFTQCLLLTLLTILLQGNLQAQTPAGALNFDGVNDYVSVANPYRTFDKEITVEFWMNAPSANMPYGSLLSQGTSGVDNMTNNVWLMHPNATSPTLTFYVNDGGTYRGAQVPITAGSWHHYAGVASASATKFYVDGVLVATGAGISGGILSNGNAVLHMGKDVRYNSGRFANTTIDEVRIWNRALCQDEIVNNMNCEPNPAVQTGLQEYYRFNQGFQGANNAAYSSLPDISGNARDGVLNNFALSGTSSNWVASGSTNTGACAVYIAPTAPITGNASVCVTSNPTLANAISGGVWSSSSTAVATIDASTGAVTTISAGTTVITYTTECGGISTFNLTVNDYPVPSITPSVVTICAGQSVTLTASGSGTYKWNTGATTTAITVSPTLSTSYSVTVTGAGGCTAAVVRRITVNPSPKPTISGNNIICSGASTVLAASGGASYLWTTNETTAAITVSPAATTTYTVTATDANGCSTAKNITVTVNPTPVASIAGNTNICAGGSTTLTASGGATYLWSTNETTAAITVSPSSSTAYTVTVSSAAGCTANTTAEITVNANPAAPAINGAVTACAGNAATITAASALTSPVFNWYGASAGGSSLFSGASFITPVLPASATYYVSVTDGNGCTSDRTAAPVKVTVINDQTLSISQSAFCASGSATITQASSQVGVNYTLRNNANNAVVAGPVAGTGSAISFNTGVVSTTTTYNVLADNKHPGALGFPGQSTASVRNGSFALNTAAGFTIEGWIFMNTTSGNNGFVSQGQGNVAGPVDIYVGNGRVAFWTGTPAGGTQQLTSTFNLSAGTWYHLACVYDASQSQMRIYINGVLNNSVGTTKLVGNVTGANLIVGNRVDNGTPMNGKLDDIRIWNSVRTAAQISSNMNTRISTPQAGLMLYYLFDDAPGTSVAADASGNNFNGTLNGLSSSAWTAGQLNCTASCSIQMSATPTVTINPLPSATISGTTTVCANAPAQMISFTGANGTAPYTFTYTINGGAPLTVTSSNNTAQVSVPAGTVGTYQYALVSVTDASSTACAAPASGSATVILNGAPSFTSCSSDISANNAAGGCSAVVSYNAAATGFPAPALSYVFSGATTGAGAGTGSGQAFNVGVTKVTITAANDCGSAVCSFNVTVTDVIPPVISCPSDITITATSAAGAVVSYLTPAGTDNCSAVTTVMTQGLFSGSVFPIGTTKVTHTATDATGLSTSCSFNVTVSGLLPVIVCPQNIVVPNTPGQCGAIVNFAATDNTGIPASTITYSVQPGTFFAVGTTTVTATATNALGSSACTFTVTVKDAERPNAVTRDATVYLDANGQAGITAADVNNGSSDNCAVETMTVAPFNFTCANVSSIVTPVKQTIVSDNTWMESTITYSNPYFCSSHVWNGVTAALPATASYTITPTINAYSVTPIPGTQGLFGLNGTRFFRKTFNLASLSGIKATLLASMDNAAQLFINGVPVALEKDLDGANFSDTLFSRVVLNSTGANVSGGTGFQPFDVITTASASDLFVVGTNEIVLALANCDMTDRGAICFKAIIETTTGGPNNVVLTVTDVNGNASSATAKVTVVDAIKPVINCPADITVYATSASGAVVNYAAPSATDNCSVSSVVKTAGPASGATFPLGTTTVTYRATDASGNYADCSFTVTVRGVAPSIVCPANVTVNSDAARCGAAVSFAAAETTGIPASVITYSIPSGSVFPVGTTMVTATAVNAVGQSVCSFPVVVEDKTPATVVTKNITIQLNASGQATIAAADVDNGSNDACGIASLSLDKTSFSCENVGQNTATLTATDLHGNISSTTAVVTVEDKTAPVVLTKNITVQLNASGQATIEAADVNNGSNDACGIANFSLDKSSFSCGNVGANTVTLTATDINGNASSATAVVTVEDKTAPVVITKNITVQLNASGQATITTADVNNNSTDACGIASLSLDKSSFTCNNVGPNTVTLTAIDINGNTGSATAVVTIEDKTPPVVITKNITVELNAAGTATISAADVDAGSSDVCGIASRNVSPSSFSCSNYGTNTVTLTVTDRSGNTSTGTAQVMITDHTAPVVITKPVSITLVNGAAAINAADVNNGSSDACGIASMILSKSSFTCSDIGTNTVVLTVTDTHGNASSASAQVTVVGSIPVITVSSVPVSNVYTGGVSTNLYLGYGAQSTNLQVNAPNDGAPYQYRWSGSNQAMLSSTSASSPLFTATQSGSYTYTVQATNKYGCSSTAAISICVTDIRVASSNNKVYVCHLPPGNTGNRQTLSISVNAVPSHLGLHPGDRLGSCDLVPCGGQSVVTSSGNTVTATTAKENTTAAIPATEDLKVTVMPNPSTSYFTLKFESRYETPLNLRVLDAAGRVLDARTKVGANSTLQLGHRYSSGIYYAEVIQGGRRKVVQMIKASE